MTAADFCHFCPSYQLCPIFRTSTLPPPPTLTGVAGGRGLCKYHLQPCGLGDQPGGQGHVALGLTQNTRTQWSCMSPLRAPRAVWGPVPSLSDMSCLCAVGRSRGTWSRRARREGFLTLQFEPWNLNRPNPILLAAAGNSRQSLFSAPSRVHRTSSGLLERACPEDLVTGSTCPTQQNLVPTKVAGVPGDHSGQVELRVAGCTLPLEALFALPTKSAGCQHCPGWWAGAKPYHKYLGVFGRPAPGTRT